MILSFLKIDVQWIGSFSLVNRIAGWLNVLTIATISLILLGLWFYTAVYFWREGIPSLFAILLSALAFGCVLAIPGNVIDQYFKVFNKLPLPLLFYVFTVIAFIANYGYAAYIFISHSKDTGILKKALPLLLLFSPMMITSFLSILYGYSSILYMQDQSIALWARVLVSIANVVYLLALLAAPPMGIAAGLTLESEEKKTR
jgi:hypothetical protein